jgi:hypothetical protein
LPQENPRGALGALIDLLSWLRIYRQRTFWIQIAATIVGILLWIIILPEEFLGGAITAFSTLVFLCFIMTNIVWAASKKPYSCIVGSSIGYGIYNLAVIAILRRDLSTLDAIIYVFLGVVYGFVFSWFAFFIFNVLGLIKFQRKKQAKDSPSSNEASK